MGERALAISARASSGIVPGVPEDRCIFERFSTPFQSWIYLSGRDAGEDATYLHTPNQNQTPFPVAISGIARMRSSSLVQEFAALLPGFSVRVGEVRSFDEDAEPPRVVSSFFVYCEGIGVPLASFQDER